MNLEYFMYVNYTESKENFDGLKEGKWTVGMSMEEREFHGKG
jgi:hypothetical protein